MRNYVKLITVFTFFLFCFPSLRSENAEKGHRVNGVVKDFLSGEMLPGAAIYIENTARGTTTNINGEFSIVLSEGDYTLTVSYVGYGKMSQKLSVPADENLIFSLRPAENELSQVNIRGYRPEENLQSTQMGMMKLDKMAIKKIPAFMGEVDVIKAIQLLPGVQSTSEGSSGFSVRGGAPDQNLIVLDYAPVYNASHLMGFFSVFNNDMVQDVTLYKGDIPASAGGRLSSYLDIKTINGKNGKIKGQGGIGTISSRLLLEGSITPKTTFALSGRRTYADLMLKLSSNPDIRDNRLYFYDTNAKLTHTFSEKDRLFISGYLGDDIFKSGSFETRFGNTIGSVRWNHVFTEKLRSDLTVFGSDYRYNLTQPDTAFQSFKWVSGVEDYGARYDLLYDYADNLSFETGISTTYHSFEPGSFYALQEKSFFGDFIVKGTQALEHGAYVIVNPTIGNRLKLKLGLRLSGFQSIGPATVFNYNSQYNVTDSVVYGKGDVYNSYWGLEPRVGFTYVVNNATSIKGSYNRNFQYMQLAQNSTSGSPFDIWFPASLNTKPQKVDQFALGLFRNVFDNRVEISVEGYYKDYDQTVDFKDHANLFLNQYLEGEFRTGEGRSYGMEMMAKFNFEKWNGWVAYTLSRAERRVDEINNGDWYLAPYDKTHDVAFVVNYTISPAFTLSANWVYATGQAVTFPTGRFEYGNKVLPIYSDRNAYRFPDYHRLDVGLTYTPKQKRERRWKSEWNLSVYNAYNRHNPWTINFSQVEGNPNQMQAESTFLFPILPAITYNFKF